MRPVSEDDRAHGQAFQGVVAGGFQERRAPELSASEIAGLVGLLDLQEALPSVARLREWSLDVLSPAPGGVAVDVGCGTDTELRRLAVRVGPKGRAVGVDINPALLQVAAERTPAGSAAEWLPGTATALPFDDQAVDVLRCKRVLQHLTDPQSAASEFARVLRPDGRAVVLDSDWGTAITVIDEADLARRVQEWGWQTHHRGRRRADFRGRGIGTRSRRGLRLGDDVRRARHQTTCVIDRSAHPDAMRDPGGLLATGHLELAQDVADVHTRRLDADVEVSGDLAVGAAGGELSEHLEFPLGELVCRERGRRGPGRRVGVRVA